MFKGLANLGSLLKQAQKIGGQMNELTEEMRRRRVVGNAGGDMVEVEVNGLMEAMRCRIDPQLITQGDRELLEDLIVAAVNQAISKGKRMHADAIRDLTGGLPLPGFFQEALEKFAEAGQEEDEGDKSDKGGEERDV